MYLIKIFTPLRLEFIATTGDHWFDFGLYLSAVDNSVASSRPPTESILFYSKIQKSIKTKIKRRTNKSIINSTTKMFSTCCHWCY